MLFHIKYKLKNPLYSQSEGELNQKWNSVILPGPLTGQTKASYLLHIYMNVWCYSTAILDALSEPCIFLPGLYCVCNEYFLLCRHFNCCQDYIWHIIWIVLCFIQLTSYVSCCFTLNANWKIHSFFTLKETSNWKKIQRFFQAFSLAKQ